MSESQTRGPVPETPNTPCHEKIWFDARIRKPGGGEYSDRQRRAILKRYEIPTFKIGWNRLVIPAEADARLAELSPRWQEQHPRRRVRPRVTVPFKSGPLPPVPAAD